MILETYLAYLVAVLIFFAHPPGPSQLLFVAHSMRLNVKKAMPTLAGDLTANSLQIMIAGFGLAGLIQLSATFFLTIKWLGVASPQTPLIKWRHRKRATSSARVSSHRQPILMRWCFLQRFFRNS